MNIRISYYIRICIALVILVFLSLGCSGIGHKFDRLTYTIKEKLDFKTYSTSFEDDIGQEEGEIDQDNQDSDYFIHTCKRSGETLAHVAEWYTGDSYNWKTLAKINTHVNPRKIAIDSDVFIPVELLKTRQPLPSNFAVKYDKGYFKHTVRWSGESLSLIAKWYTGSFQNWKKLAKANPRLKPNYIKLGDVIWIPPRLLITRKSLPQKVAAKYTPHYFAHTVKYDGENLQEIAGWYTGDSGNWKALAKANPRINANHLVMGNEIFIPSELLKVRDPIPAAKPTPPAAETDDVSPAPEPGQAPVTEENIELFGPKQFPRG